MQAMNAAGSACPCGRLDERRRPVALADCCGRYVEHFADCPAPSAEHLMRSRYTAFVLGRVEYLLATWHSAHRPAELTLEPATKWLGLEVKSHRLLADDAQATDQAMSYDGSTARRTTAEIRDNPLAKAKGENGDEVTAVADWPKHADGKPDFARMNSAQRLAYDSARLR